jgi:hypothetical protein
MRVFENWLAWLINLVYIFAGAVGDPSSIATVKVSV